MSDFWVALVLKYVGLYLGIGFLFSLIFVSIGVGRIDPVARQGSRGFRILIIPGVAAFWPLLAWRWLSRHGKPPIEKNNHRRLAVGKRLGDV